MPHPIGQAIYGERDRAHRLLSASSSFPSPDTLAGRMDMQGSPPPYTDWPPYLSGFAWNDHYVFARTLPDPTSARAGMVFSRAFALPKALAADHGEIFGLLELLTKLGDARNKIDDIDLPPPSRPTGSPGLVQTLLTPGPSPIVWPGHEGFDEAISSLWSQLWPAARLALSFRIAFSPTDVADPPTVVTTPASLLSRWSGFRIVRPDAVSSADDAAELYLLGAARSDGLIAMVEAFGPRLPGIADLRSLIDIDRLLASGGDFADHVDALRLACHLAPDVRSGDAIKRAAVMQAVAAMPRATAAEVRMARNLDLAPVASRQDFWRGLSAWAKTRLWQEHDPATIGQVLEEAYSVKPNVAWREAIVKSTHEILKRPSVSIAKLIWSVLAQRPHLLAAFAQVNGRSRAFETALVGVAPAKLAPGLADGIADQALAFDMPTLHAACCAAALAPADAMRRHLAEAPFDAQSLAIAARKAKGEDLVSVALERDDDLTLDLASNAAADSPKLFRLLDATDARWRALWREALERGAGLRADTADPAGAIVKLLDGVANGAIVDIPLLEAISVTPLADLTRYPRREELWARLQEPSLTRFLNATADGWLAAIGCGEDLTCDSELARALVSPSRLDPALARLARHPAAGCHIFRALPQLDEARFGRWLEDLLQRTTTFEPQDAVALGRMVAARNWERSARIVADAMIEGRSSLRPALDYIVDMIGFLRRYELDAWGDRMPSAAKWGVLGEIATELYGSGPNDSGLWQRAGGKESDLPKAENGAETWRKVLAAAEKGKGAIDPAKLIKVMYEDYPGHRALSKLRWDWAFARGGQ